MADTVLRGRVLRLLMAAGLTLSACSSEDGAVDESASPDPAEETSVAFGDGEDSESDGSEADNIEADDDGAEASTDAADGTDATTSSTSQSSNDDDQVAAIEAEVERVIRRNWEIWVECTTDIESCDPSSELAETEDTASQFYLESVGVVELWQQQGIAYRPVEGRPVDRFVEIRSIDVAADLMSAEVLLCDRDDRARFQRNAGGGYEMVEGTDVGEDLLLRRVLVVTDGDWKIVENELLDRRHVQEGIDPLC